MVALKNIMDSLNCNADKNEKFTIERPTIISTKNGPRSTQDIASFVTKTLFDAEKKGSDLLGSLRDTVRQCGWTETLGKAILSEVEAALREGAVMGQVMQEASVKAMRAAYGFAHDHPVFCTLIALGILALLAPWALEAIGFGVEGPIKGKCKVHSREIDTVVLMEIGRDICRMVAVEVCGIRSKRSAVLVLPKVGDDMEMEVVGE